MHKRLLFKLGLVVVGMFCFGFALVPIYNVMCQQLGINGKTGDGVDYQIKPGNIDKSRKLLVQFIANNNASVPWEFGPSVNKIEVHPGEIKKIHFIARNRSKKTMVVQAIPSVAPGRAAKYLKKTECFCFTQQTLDSRNRMEMPLLFHIDKELPKEITEVTLSYTLFDVTHMKNRISQTPGRII